MGAILSAARNFATNWIPGISLIEQGDQTNEESPEISHSHANSRLNLINQLLSNNTNRTGGLRSKSKNSNGLNDFQGINFASNYYMAGRKFKNLIDQNQTFLFGDQLDLGFILTHKPANVKILFQAYFLNLISYFNSLFSFLMVLHPWIHLVITFKA